MPSRVYVTNREPPALLVEQIPNAEPEGEPHVRITEEQIDPATDASSSAQV